MAPATTPWAAGPATTSFGAAWATDTLAGGAGDDLLSGGEGNDHLSGGTGADVLVGGDDVVLGGEGDDRIIAGVGEGDDTYDGGPGTDTLEYTSDSEGVSVNLATGVAQGETIDTDSSVAIENVIAGDGDDVLIGDAGANVLVGGGGDDFIVGGPGDTLVGGPGVDTVRVQLTQAQFSDPEFRAELEAFIGAGGAFRFESIDLDVAGFEQIQVEVDGALVPNLSVADAGGAEDTAIALTITPEVGGAGGEVLSITVANIPDGAILSADSGPIAVAGGSATLAPADLAGLNITPPANSSDNFALQVTVTATSPDGTANSVSSALNVAVGGIADAPDLTVSNAAGTEDRQIALDIAPELIDADGSETLSVTISGVPDGATIHLPFAADVTFVADEDESPNELILQATPAQIATLGITPPANFSGDFTLGITATTTEDGTAASTAADLVVTVTGVADAPSLDVDPALAGDQLDGTVSGPEDSAIALDIAAALTDVEGETLSITLTGIPDGATLVADTGPIDIAEDGSATLTPGDPRRAHADAAHELQRRHPPRDHGHRDRGRDHGLDPGAPRCDGHQRRRRALGRGHHAGGRRGGHGDPVVDRRGTRRYGRLGSAEHHYQRHPRGRHLDRRQRGDRSCGR